MFSNYYSKRISNSRSRDFPIIVAFTTTSITESCSLPSRRSLNHLLPSSRLRAADRTSHCVPVSRHAVLATIASAELARLPKSAAAQSTRAQGCGRQAHIPQASSSGERHVSVRGPEQKQAHNGHQQANTKPHRSHRDSRNHNTSMGPFTSAKF